MQFEEYESEEGDGSKVIESSKGVLQKASLSYGLKSVEALERALTVRSVLVAGENIDMVLSPAEAADARNALCKEVYGRIFIFIVAQANKSLLTSKDKGKGSKKEKKESKEIKEIKEEEHNYTIGLLDIFGFEVFETNSLEQLLINYANEKLQQFFLQYVLLKEQKLYDSEGIEFNHIMLSDNEPIIELFETEELGILPSLDSQLRLPKPSDGGFLGVIDDTHGGEDSTDPDSGACFFKSGRSRSMFKGLFLCTVGVLFNVEWCIR